MARLAVRVGGLALASPVIAAAGPATDTARGMAAAVAGGAAAVVTRTLSVAPPPPLTDPGWTVVGSVRGTLLHNELWWPLSPGAALAELEQAQGLGVPLIVSLGFAADHVRALAPLVKPVASAVELCTQFLADDMHLMAEAVRVAKSILDVPVWVKLMALGRDVTAWAQAAKDAGADAVVAMGPFGPCLGVDAEAGRVLFPGTGGYAWLTGAAIKPIALRCVWDIARRVDIPVVGCGGVARGADAVEFIMAGAAAVQVGSAAIVQGAQVFGKIVRELEAWLDSHGWQAVADLRGYTQRRIGERPFRTNHLPPLLNADLCIGCEICPTSCVYGALEMVGEPKTPGYKVRLIAERCWGCGICATRCPTRALRMAGVSMG